MSEERGNETKRDEGSNSLTSPSKELCALSGGCPVEMPVQEFEGPHAMDGVRAVENLHRRASSQPELVVAAPGLGKLVGDPLVRGDAVIVAALDHEWPRADQPAHLRVVERVAQVKLVHVVLAGEHVAVGV